MSKGKQGSWDIPQYNTPQPSNFSSPLGSSYFKDNTYGFNFSPQAQADFSNLSALQSSMAQGLQKQSPVSFSNNVGTGWAKDGNFGADLSPDSQAYNQQLTAMRDSIFKNLGYTSPAREASLNQWQDTFTKEALRTAQPQYEQSMFARGLGGSAAYTGGLNDLLTKVNTQGVLNREQLSLQDQNQQLAYLSQINPEIANLIQQQNYLSGQAQGQNQFNENLKLQQLAAINPLWAAYINQANQGAMNQANQGNTQNQQAWQQYQDMLPYTAKYNQGKPGTWGTVGGLAGAALGTLVMPGVGTQLGYSLGSSLGGMANNPGAPQSGLDLSSLASLFGGMGQKQFANTAGQGRVRVAPVGYANSGGRAF